LAFSDETKELLEIGMQAQRHAAVMRWAKASQSQAAQQAVQAQPHIGQPPPLPEISIQPQPQQQPKRGIRI